MLNNKVKTKRRTISLYNLELIDFDLLEGKYQIPTIKNDGYIPNGLIGFNYARTSKNKDNGIHFYLDDYQFERLWNDPNKYIDLLSKYECILSPDFSLYYDMPLPIKLWNIYRSRLLGQYYQSCGIKVIPTISWAGKDTYDFCFEGILTHSIVSISTIGVRKKQETLKIWKDGVEEMIKRINPSTILIYGDKIDYDFKNINIIYYNNDVIKRMNTFKEIRRML